MYIVSEILFIRIIDLNPVRGISLNCQKKCNIVFSSEVYSAIQYFPVEISVCWFSVVPVFTDPDSVDIQCFKMPESKLHLSIVFKGREG